MSVSPSAILDEVEEEHDTKNQFKNQLLRGIFNYGQKSYKKIYRRRPLRIKPAGLILEHKLRSLFSEHRPGVIASVRIRGMGLNNAAGNDPYIGRWHQYSQGISALFHSEYGKDDKMVLASLLRTAPVNDRIELS